MIAFKEVFKVPAGEMENVSRIFDLAKQDVHGYEGHADQLASLLEGNRHLLADVLEGLFTLLWPTAYSTPARRNSWPM